MGHVEPDSRAAQREMKRLAARHFTATIVRTLRYGLGIGALVMASAAAAADIKLMNAWVRPMQAGDKAIPAFVDIKPDAAVTLVEASSPVARSVAIMLEGDSDGSGKPPPLSETKRFEVPAGAGRRLALNGDHLELRGILETKLSGAKVPLQLTFADAKGTRIVVETVATVRGLVPRSALPPGAED